MNSFHSQLVASSAPILIVDDEATNIFALTQIMKIKFGIEADCAYDLKTALT